MSSKISEGLGVLLPYPRKGVRVLIVEARFYSSLADALLEGAKEVLEKAGASWSIATVPGALEIPAAILFASECKNGLAYDGYVALGTVIRGETFHFEIVAKESARGLTDLSIQKSIAIGNGILTTENEQQAWERANKNKGNKGGLASQAALTMISLKERFGVYR